MASFTVNFSDGTSHVYDNVPDGIDPQNVQDRASMEFGDKKVTGVTGNQEPNEESPSIGTQIGGGAQMVAEAIGQHPKLASAAAELGLAALPQTNIPVLKQAQQLAKAPINIATSAANALNRVGTTPAGPVAPQSSRIVIPQNTGGVPRNTGIPNISPGNPSQTFQALGDRYSPATPTAATAPTPPATSVPQAQQQAGNFLNTITQKYGQVANKVAPVMNKIAPMLEGAGKMIAPAMLAKELFYTSPEEQAQLKDMEQNHTGLKDWVNDHLLSQKQNLERQQLANKHATEMTKYYSAKQKMGNQ